MAIFITSVPSLRSGTDNIHNYFVSTFLADNEIRSLPHRPPHRDDRSSLGRGGVGVEVVAEGESGGLAPGSADSRGAVVRLHAPGMD